MRQLPAICFVVAQTVLLSDALAQVDQPFHAIDLYPLVMPGGTFGSYAQAASQGQAVGFGVTPAYVDYHAIVWSRLGDVADLHPSQLPAFVESYGQGTDGVRQVGYGGLTDGSTHALLWSGSAASVVDLNPPSLRFSEAMGIAGHQEVGFGGGTAAQSQPHALLWNDTAASAIDLHPNLPLFSDSEAYATNGTQQVGIGRRNGSLHALLWSGTAQSAVDLNPLSGYSQSAAVGIGGNQQVGWARGAATGANTSHAMLWTGSASSAVDLHPTVLSGFTVSSALATNGYSDGPARQQISATVRRCSGTAPRIPPLICTRFFPRGMSAPGL